MGTQVALPAGSPNKPLIEAALALAPVLPDGDVDAAIASLSASLRPLKEVEPGSVVADASKDLGFRFDGRGTGLLADGLRPIGLKINPTMSPAQVGAWIAVMVASLADLPSRVAVKAVEDALHVPIRFFPEVEGVIRELAAPHAARFRAAVLRLERLKREIADAGKPALPAPDPAPPLGPDDYARMARNDLGRALLRMGLANGSVSQEDFDAAMSPLQMEEVNDG